MGGQVVFPQHSAQPSSWHVVVGSHRWMDKWMDGWMVNDSPWSTVPFSFVPGFVMVSDYFA